MLPLIQVSILYGGNAATPMSRKAQSATDGQICPSLFELFVYYVTSCNVLALKNVSTLNFIVTICNESQKFSSFFFSNFVG